MPAPTSYSEATLKTFMVEELSAVATTLSLTITSPSIVNAVYAVERLVGVAIAAQTDMAKLEAIAVWRAWLAAEAAAVTQFDVSLTGGKKFTLSQIWDHIQSRLAQAAAAASVYAEVAAILAGADSTPVVTSIPSATPYGWPDEWA